MLTTSAIRLIVADIDGCFTAGGRDPIDLDLCARIRQWNARSHDDPAIPAFCFCTGRPLPYVHAINQFVGLHMPSLAEFGCVLWEPRDQCHLIHPMFGPGERALYYQLLAEIEADLLSTDERILLEGGKFCQVTLYPRRPATMDWLAEHTASFVARWAYHYTMDYTHSVMSFLPRGIDKGTGLDWLSSVTGIPVSAMAGIGDADSDWEFLGRCGIAATPSNGRPGIKARAHWVLDGGPRDCIGELYERVIAHNKIALP